MEQDYFQSDICKNIINIYMESGIDKVTETMENDIIQVYAALLGEPPVVLSDITEMVLKKMPYDNFEITVYWYSFLLKVNPTEKLLCEFLQFLLQTNQISPNTSYFLFYQIKSLMFNNSCLDTMETKYLIWKYFEVIYKKFVEKSVLKDASYIPLKERNQGLILVITEQFISFEHGPTKTALDRCSSIIESLNKEVVLFNTGEALSLNGYVPLFSTMEANYLSEYLNTNNQLWKGITIPYIQFKKGMPDIEIINEVLLSIKELRPLCIVSIGGNSMLANLCNSIVPVVAINLCPSDFEYTCTQFQALGRKMNEEDEKLLARLRISKKSVIESVFTSGLKQQNNKLSRKQLGIPEDKFIIAVIGGRLEREVSIDFVHMIKELDEKKICVVFVGTFENYESFTLKYEIKKNCVYIGYQDDILAVLDNVDLYINPLRKGGGTSAVEAMSKGIPVITLSYGDVAVNAGEAFCVADYFQMAEKIRKYEENREFYINMSKVAKERSEVLLNTDDEFKLIINEVLTRESIKLQSDCPGR
jgi:glycosyltransferase involved in cell wall biosynthesis